MANPSRETIRECNTQKHNTNTNKTKENYTDEFKDFEPNTEEKFKKLSSAICRLLAQEGLNRIAYSEGLPHFSKLSFDMKTKVVHHLQFYHDLCQEQVAEGYTLKDNPSFAWRALKKLGLTPRSDLFSHLTNDMIVEIYSRENVQIFRNFRFFEFCSYTLEELLTIEWWNLFERDPKITNQLFQYASQLLSGEITGNIAPKIGTHIVSEKFSADKNVLNCKVGFAGPLLKNQKPEAFIAFSMAEILQHPSRSLITHELEA